MMNIAVVARADAMKADPDVALECDPFIGACAKPINAHRSAPHRSDFGSDQGANTLCTRMTMRNRIRLMATSPTRPAKACEILKNDVENAMKKPSPFSAATNSATTAPTTASVVEIFRAENR